MGKENFSFYEIGDDVPEGFVDQIIFALSGAVEAKDRYTSGHSRRVAEYAREMAKRLGYSEDEQRSFSMRVCSTMLVKFVYRTP